MRSLSLAKQGRGSNAWREKGAASGLPRDEDKDERAMATGMRPYATSVCGLKLLVYEAFSY
jgi:hypothetical protein